MLADPEYRAGGYQQAFGFRTVLGVPLLRERTTIGVFVLTRDEVNPFTDKQIELVTTFADQAVIAIENVRLFEAEQQRTRELTESLEQQTATSEVLQVIISSSDGDPQPVFEHARRIAAQLCEAEFGTQYLRGKAKPRLVAAYEHAARRFSRGSSKGAQLSHGRRATSRRRMLHERKQVVQVARFGRQIRVTRQRHPRARRCC